MTYNVFSGTLNPTQSINLARYLASCCWKHIMLLTEVLWTQLCVLASYCCSAVLQRAVVSVLSVF